MAGEDVLIRVGVDYSAAIASTRQFEQELRRILASSAQSAVASAAATTSAALSASTANRGALPQQAAGQLSAVPDYTRELTSINKNLEILVQLTRSNTNRTVIFSEGPRTTPVAVSAPPPVVTTSSTPRPVAAPVAPPRPVQVARPTPVASFANDRAARELATAQTAYANTLRQLATRAVAPVQVAAPAPVSHVAPRALPQPTTRVLDTTPVQTAMASVVAELNKVRQPSQVSGAAIAAQLSAEMTPFRVMMTSLTAAMSSARASVAQLSAASAGAGRVLEAVGARSGGSTGPSGSSFGGSGSPPPPPIPPQPSSPPPQPPPSPRGLSSGPTPLGLPSGDWQSPWIGEFDEALKRRVNGWIKQRVAEVGQGPSGTPIATPWVHPTVSWSQPIPGNLGPIRPDLVMPPVRTMLGPGPEVSRPVIDTTATQRSQDLVLAQRDYATSLRRASDVTNQQAARYVDLKTIQRPPTDLLGLGPGRFAEKTSEAAGRRVLPSSGQTYPMPVSSARQLLDHPSPRQSKVDRLLSDDQFRGMPPDVAERFQSTARRVFESLPGLSKYVGAIGTETFPEIPDVWGAGSLFGTSGYVKMGRVPGSSANGRARRPVFDRDGNVIEGGRIGVNPAISEAEIARAVRSGAKAGAPDVSRVAAHELGHQIDYVGQNAYIQKLFPGSRLGSGNYQAGYEQYVDELRGIITKGQPGMSVQDILRRDISGYAADMFDKKPGEAMAEATALMYTGKVNPTAQRIYDWTVRQSGLGPTSDAFGTIGDQGEANLPVLARQQQLLDRQIAYETAAVRGPSSGQIPLPTQSATLRDRLALDSGKESRASAEIVLAKDGLAAEYRRVAKQLRAKAELEARSVLPSSGKPIVPSSDRSKIKGIPREVSDWILRNSGPNDTFSADELVDAYHASRKYRDRIKAEAGQVYGDELWELEPLQRPPLKERRRKLSGETYWGYAGGEWDWFDSLDDSYKRRLLKRMEPRRFGSLDPVKGARPGISPDAVASDSLYAQGSGSHLRNASSDEAMMAYVRKIDRADAARSVSRGRMDSEALRHVDLDEMLPVSFDTNGISAYSIMTDPISAMLNVARQFSQLGSENAWAELGRPRGSEGAPWTMSRADWSGQLLDALSARDYSTVDRLYPPSVFSPLTGPPMGLDDSFDKIRHLATLAGMDDIHSSPYATVEPDRAPHPLVPPSRSFDEDFGPSLDEQRQLKDMLRRERLRESQGIYSVSREAVLLAGGGAGGIPPSPPRIGSGFGDEDDDEVRRLKAQLAAALRQRIQALNTETEASKQIAATTSGLRDTLGAGLSGSDPFGFRALNLTAGDLNQRRQEELNRARYRQAAQEIVPPGPMRPRFLAGPNAHGGVGDPFNFGSLNLGVGSGVADPEIIAANQARRSPFQRFSTLDEAQEARRAGDDQAYRGLVASVVPKGAERARFMLSNDPFGYGGFEQELLRDIGAQRRALSAGPVAGLGRLALPVAPEPIELGGEAWRARNRTEFKEWVDATRRDAESPTRTRGRHQASPEEIEYAEGQVAGARLRAGASRHIEGDPELRDDLASSQATLHTNRFDQKQRRNEAIDDQGRADTLPKSERKRLGAMLPEEEIADFEQRATKFSKAVGRITDQDLKTPEGRDLLNTLGGHGQRLRAEMEGVIAPEGDGVLAESLYRSRKLVDSGISDVDFASGRKETRATAEAREAAEARRATQAEAATARKRFLNESPAGQMQNLKGYLGALREEMGSLRVNPDITAAKQKFAELSALLSALEEKAASIEVDPEDGRAVENYAKLRSGIQQQRANLEGIGAQLGQRETFAKYEQDMAAWRQARAGRSAGRKFTDWFTMRSADEPVMPEGYAPTGGGRGGGGGADGGGPGGLGGADGPNDRRGFSRFLYNARHRGGALGFFETGALSTLRYGLPSMAMYGAMSGISNATREAEEFRFTMEKVRAQLADTFGSGSDQIFEHFKNNILDLSKETGVQADVLASLGMQFQGAFGSETIGGLSGQALVESQLSSAAKLSQVTKIPAAELTDGLTAASFGFDRTNEDISNVALRLESLSGVTAKETIGFIGDIAPVATEAGFSLEELASMAAIAQQKSGRSGAALAESFGRIIPAISNSKDKLLELADADKALQAPEFLKALSGGDIKSTLLFLVKNFQNLTKSSQDFVVTALGGRREAQALLAAVGDQGQLDRYISGAEDSDGTLEARFKSAQSTLTVQMQRLRQEFNLFVASLLESGLADVLSGLVATVSLMVKGFEQLLTISGGINDFFGGLPGKIMGVVAAIVAMRVALGFVSKSGGGLIRRAFEIPREATIRGTLANTASGVWAGTRQGGLLGALSGRIGAARAAYAGLPPIGAQMVLPGMEAAGASAAAGAAGASTASSGLGAAVTAFTGVSTTALAAGGLALGALAGTYLMIRHSLDRHSEEAKNIANWARDSKTSVEDIQNLIDSSESDGGPGIWTSIWGGLAGKRYLGVRDQYRAELARKKITSSERKQIEGLSSSSAEDQIDELITDTINVKIPKADKAYRTPNERRDARREVSVAKKRRADLEKEVRKAFSLIDDDGLAERGLGVVDLNDYVSNEASRGANKLLRKFAKLAGVKTGKLEGSVAKALASGKAKEELQKIRDDENSTDNEIRQATAAQLSLSKGDKDIDTEVKVSKSSQTIETITKNYKAGVIGYNTYVQRVKENLETLRNNIAVTGGTDEQRQRQAQLIAELSQEISQKAVDATQMQLDNFQTTSGAAPETMAKARVMQYSALIKSGKLSGEQRLEVVKQLFQAQRDLLTKAIENADSGAEVEKIVAEGARIDPETRINAIIGGISKLNGNWVTFTETFRTIFGESAGAYIGSLVRAMDAGTMTNAEVRADLIKRIEVLQQTRKNLLRRGTPTDAAKAKMQAVDETINNLYGEIVSIDTTGSFTNDPGSKITPEAEAALQADLKGIQSRSAHDQALARGNSIKKARIGVQAARDVVAATKKYKPDDEAAIRDAETKLLDAEAAERESIRDRSRALVDRAKSFARARHDSVGAAQLDVQAAFLDLKAAQEEGDEAGIARAQGSIAEAVEAERQSRVNKIIQFMELGKALNSKGDTVQDSLIDRDIAQVRLNNATGDDVAQAMIDLKKAEDAIRQALIGRFNSLVELQKLENGDDPLADARIDLNAAQTMLALAQNEDEKINAQKQLLTAEKQIQDAMRDVRNSRYELRQAELTAMGDEVGASMTAAQLARAQLSEALQLANQGKGPGEAEINRLRAAVATADKAASDTAFQDKLDDYSFLYNMGQLTKSEYVNYLEGLKSTLIPGTKQFKDLELQIKQLKDDISGGLQMNLPTSLALPTLYEARRLNQIGESTGGNGTYNDSRTYNVIVNVDSSMSQADLVNALNNAMGNGVVGSDVRLY